MIEIIINLILTGLFFQAQLNEQKFFSDLIQNNYRLPPAEDKKIAKVAPQRDLGSTSLGVEVTAKSVLVLDKESEKILYEKNSQEARAIASLTKLMTALVFLEHNPGWNQKIIIKADDYRPGATPYLVSGEEVTVRDLFAASLIASSNEATAALARASGLTNEEFIAAMNQKAKDIGMAETAFVDVTGLADGNQSTAQGVMLLIRIALAQPEIFKIISTKEYQVNILNKGLVRRIISTDRILRQSFGLADKSYFVEAGKTGFLEKAGYCFASKVSDKNNKKILIVVLGSASLDDRFIDTKSLAYWIFNNYIWQ